jgi:hypothetical protein
MPADQRQLGAQGIDPHGPRDILDLLLAKILEGVIELVADVIAHHSADADTARFGEGLQSCRDIHAVAEDVVLLDNHVAEVDADAESDTLVLGRFGIAFRHAALDLHGAAHGINDARKLCQEAVAGILYDTASVLLDLRLYQLPEMGLQALVRPLLVGPHQARIARHIGGEDRGKAADRGHGSPGGKVP